MTDNFKVDPDVDPELQPFCALVYAAIQHTQAKQENTTGGIFVYLSEQIEREHEKFVSIVAVHAALGLLEQKKYLRREEKKARKGTPSASRKVRERWYFLTERIFQLDGEGPAPLTRH